ncbi:hypothetical protein AHiyo8_04900 [Arthrobacter sp. Hiyo8]|nr:hypothetical protein AHiyo8_04900 [Arthrobacter sp. Hiyo8]
MVSRLTRPCLRTGASFATPSKVKVKASRANGMLSAKRARQPSAPASTPPSGKPTTAVTWAAIEKLPKTRPGTPMPDSSARRRTSAIAVG